MLKMKNPGENRLYSFFVLAVIIVTACIFIFSEKIENKNKSDYYGHDFVEAEVLEVKSENLEKDPVVKGIMTGNQKLRLKILEGEYKGREFDAVNILDFTHNVLAKKGLKLIAGINRSSDIKDENSVWVYNYKRSNILFILILLFFTLIAVFGGGKGFKAILSLLFTGAVLIKLFIPLILKGWNIYILATAATLLSLTVSFILISGFKKKTLVAILGSLSGILASGIIAVIFGKIAHISLINFDRGTELAYISRDYGFEVRGLMYSAILIASLGAIMDVAMSMASSMHEIYTLEPNISFSGLLKSGLNIGRDIMGTMTNTIILVFLGSSLGLCIILKAYNMPFVQISNLPFIAVQLVQGVSGSIGIVLTVPVTALFSCLMYKKTKV